MLTKINKFGISSSLEERNRIQDRIFQFVRGETSQEAEEVRKALQGDIDFLNEENATLTIEVNESKRKIQSLLEKTEFIERRLEDTVQEASMHKGRVESMIEENRKLINESLVLSKSNENQKTTIIVLEKQNANLERELTRYTKVNVKSNIAEAEIRQKKAM
jgi:hypothetical protein